VFRVTDPSYQPVRLPLAPTVYWDQAPSQAYRAVGLLSITVADGTPREQINAEIVKKAQDVGCDVLVSTTARKAARADGFRLVHDDGGSGHERPTVENERPQKTFELVCGKWSAPSSGGI